MAKRSKSPKLPTPGKDRSASGPTQTREPKPLSPLDMALLGLAGVGIVLTAYLTYGAWFGVHPAFCSEGSGCDLVQNSRWATFFGLPMAFWGLLTYIVMAKLDVAGSNQTGELVVAVVRGGLRIRDQRLSDRYIGGRD